MIRVEPVIVVEGKYDKNKVLQLFDATVIDTRGFGIFSDREKQALLRRLANSRGLLVFTDSDGAGLVIRNLIKNISGGGKVWHAYIPEIPGREKRKKRPGKEGLLGVEGVSDSIILEAVKRSGALDIEAAPRGNITRLGMYQLGLTGGAGSRALRQWLCQRLELPRQISASDLLNVLNMLMDENQLAELMAQAKSI